MLLSLNIAQAICVCFLATALAVPQPVNVKPAEPELVTPGVPENILQPQPDEKMKGMCTKHEFQDRTYYYNWDKDESLWDVPPPSVCNLVDMPDESKMPSSVMVAASADTYLFYERLQTASESVPPNSITLTIQADMNRIERGLLNRAARQWQGPISVAILASSLSEIRQYLDKRATRDVKKWVDVHGVVVSVPRKHYPINTMRNHAIKSSRSQYLMVLDIDEELPFTMQVYQQYVNEASTIHSASSRALYVLTAWQWNINSPPASGGPRNGKQLYDMLGAGKAAVKHPHYARAYAIPGVGPYAWANLKKAIEVDYADSFEAYFIARKSELPLYDERFVGFGGNKAIHTMRLAMDGWEFVLLPEVFVWSNETPLTAVRHKPPANPRLIRDAWWEAGHMHGCDACKIDQCVKNCPNIFKHSAKKQKTTDTATSKKSNVMRDQVMPEPGVAGPMPTSAVVPKTTMTPETNNANLGKSWMEPETKAATQNQALKEEVKNV